MLILDQIGHKLPLLTNVTYICVNTCTFLYGCAARARLCATFMAALMSAVVLSQDSEASISGAVVFAVAITAAKFTSLVLYYI